MGYVLEDSCSSMAENLERSRGGWGDYDSVLVVKDMALGQSVIGLYRFLVESYLTLRWFCLHSHDNLSVALPHKPITNVANWLTFILNDDTNRLRQVLRTLRAIYQGIDPR